MNPTAIRTIKEFVGVSSVVLAAVWFIGEPVAAGFIADQIDAKLAAVVEQSKESDRIVQQKVENIDALLAEQSTAVAVLINDVETSKKLEAEMRADIKAILGYVR